MTNSFTKSLVGALAVLTIGATALPAFADASHNGSGHNAQTPGAFPADGVVSLGLAPAAAQPAGNAFTAFFEPSSAPVVSQTHDLGSGHSGR